MMSAGLLDLGNPGSRPGGRLHARRVLLSAVATLVLGALPAASAAVDREPPDAAPQVTVREQKGLFIVAARFSVPQPEATAMAVLTDYEGIPRFMPDIRSSTVLEREGGRAIVEQEAVGRVMLFSKRVHLVLEIRQQPGEIRFRDLRGSSFARYEGAWRIAAEDGRTTIAYELVAKPAFDVPGFVLKRLLRRDARETIAQLRVEMAARFARLATRDGSGGARYP